MRVLLALLCVSCAVSEPNSTAKWLINEETKQVMGIVAKSAPSSIVPHHYVLLECDTYDSFMRGVEFYKRVLPLPTGCRILVQEKLSDEDLIKSVSVIKEEMSKQGFLQRLMEKSASKLSLSVGTLTVWIGASMHYSNLFSDIVKRLREMEILPKIEKGKRLKKFAMAVTTAILLVRGVSVWGDNSKDKYYQVILDEFAGSRYAHLRQDHTLSSDNYQSVREMLERVVLGEEILPAEVANP